MIRFTELFSLGGYFMAQFSTHLYFGNSAEEFHPYETLSAPTVPRNFHHLSSLIQYHVSIFNVHETI
jgi:hypothetical protein